MTFSLEVDTKKTLYIYLFSYACMQQQQWKSNYCKSTIYSDSVRTVFKIVLFMLTHKLNVLGPIIVAILVSVVYF